uniref:Uncharacterized protein n=1 Tax=viral metagenome TaxID=1070528 RepID=A0A6C0EK19_9ZZZZ
MNCSKKFIMDKCNNNNDFHCQRKCNISKMEELYNKELQKYYLEYNKYLHYKYDRTADKSRKKLLAETVIRPNIIKINNNLNNILINLKKHIKNTNNLIQGQKHEIANKNNNIYRQNTKIKHQINLLKEKEDSILSKERQVDTGLDRNRYKRNSMYVIFIINIILFISVGYLLNKN